MSVSSISATIASVALAFLILGFVFGWVRGYQKSLTRLIIVLVVAVVAFFVTPALTNAVLNFNLAKYGVTVNGEAVATVKDYIIAMISQIEQVNELMQSSATLKAFVTAVPAMLVNVVLFTVIFFLLKWISMVIYWIFAGTLFSKKRLEGKNKVKIVGAGVGTLQALVALAILLVPFFGFANILNNVNQEYNNANQAVVASANIENRDNVIVTVADETENGQIETTIKEADKYVTAFENTWVVKVYSAFGINKLSVGIFNDLSTQKVNNIETNLTKELTAVSKMLPYVDNIMSNGTEINTAFVNNLDKLFENAFESEILNNIVNEVVSTASGKWVNGEQFLGLEMPKIEGNDDINNIITKVFEGWQNNTATTLKTDVNAVVSVLRILTEDNVINSISSGNAGDILDALSNENKNTISDLISAMLSSNTLKNVIPDILNVGLDYVYDALGITVAEGSEEEYKITATADEITWDLETVKIQKILGNIARVYADYENNYIKFNEGKPESEQKNIIEVIDFSKIGIALDSMKSSELFGTPSQKIFESLLDNEMLSVIPEATRTSLKENWATINMEATFTSLNEMVKLAINISDATTTITKDNIANVLDTIVSEGVNSEVVESILSKENLQNAGLDEETAGSISEVVTEITTNLSGKTEEEKQKEINGIATAIDIISQAQGKAEGETITIEDTDATIDAIANSSIITGLIESETSAIGSLDVSTKIDNETKENLQNSISNNQALTETQKQALLNMLVGTN